MGAIPLFLDEQERASSPLIRLTIKSVKREEKKVTQIPTENPYELVAMESESEGTYERIVTPITPTQEGTPQGGVVAPVLANVALHGLETIVVQRLTRRVGTTSRKVSPTVVRYADAFVVLDEDLTVMHQAQETITEWLTDMGLELKPWKTTWLQDDHQANKRGSSETLARDKRATTEP